MRTFLSTLAAALGLAVPAMAQTEEEPAVERDTVLLKPLHFERVDPSNEAENQRLWNELMKYKLWGTDSVIFNKGKFRIAETSGFTGTAKGKVYLRNGEHTLGGPIISGNDIEISYPGLGADKDSLLKGPVRAGWLVLPGWYAANDAKYEGIYCFEKSVFFDSPDRHHSLNDASTVVNRFIANVHKTGGKIYADWDKDFVDPELGLFEGIPALNLDGSFSECPEEVPQPEKNLTVPVLDLSGITWEPAISLTATVEETKYIHIPPITAADLAQSPKKVWYDKFVENIEVGGHTGKILYILMPSNKQNANRKTGRLTRIFSRDGFNFDNSANDMRIQVAYVNDDATWNEGNHEWENLDASRMTFVSDDNYAGNLLFYTTANVEWRPFKASSGEEQGKGAQFQGTFMTSGTFKIYDHLSIAGQLIAGKWLWFESEFNGEFHYVPFNSPEIKTDIFVKDLFKERNDYWYSMDFYLTDTAHTEVSFDYCFAFFGIDVDTTGNVYDLYKSPTGSFVEPADLNMAANAGDKNSEKYMPLCSKPDDFKHVVIKRGERRPTDPYTSAHINILEDDKIEGDEYMLFKIMNLNGAIISGNKFGGGILVKIMDSDNKPPHFVDLENVRLAVPENATKALAGVLDAEDDEGDEYAYEIVGGSAEELFQINNKGEVSMRSGVEPFDYEAWKAAGTKLTLDIEVCDTKDTQHSHSTFLCDSRTFTVSIIDVNEKPYFDYTADEKKEIKIAENLMNAAEAVKTADLDTYIDKLGIVVKNSKFTNNEVVVIGGDVDDFGVSKAGVIYAKHNLDYELKSTYKITLRVRDVDTKNYPDLYDDMEFTITVTDVDDGPKFEFAAYNGTVDENSIAGTVVDLDHAIVAKSTLEDATITYKLLDETKSFVIDPVTGVITVAEGAVLDFETKDTYEMKVVASDESGVEGQIVQTDTADVIIKLNDLKHYLKETVFEIAEDAAKESKIKPSLETTEPGIVDDAKYTYYILDGSKEVSSNKVFELDPETGTFSVVAGLDYETKDSYSIKVRVKNAIGNSSDTTVTINIIDVNEAPSILVDTIYVKENHPVDEPFSTVKTDKDDPDTKNPDFRNNVYTNTDGSKIFKVDSNGDVILLKPLDYEADSVYTIDVRVSDKEDNTLTSTKKVVVKVVDVYERSEVEITRVEDRDSIYLKPDSVFVNDSVVGIEWTRDGKIDSSVDSLKEGCNVIIKKFHDKTKNDPGADTVVVCFSSAAPIVTVSANGDDVTADNIYTVVEKATKNDTAVYVNEKKNDIKVTVNDTASHVTKSFTVKLELDTVAVSSKNFKSLKSVADSEITRKKNPDSGITSVPENGTTYKNSYTDEVNGVKVTVSYYTDKNGKDVKRSVITSSGKTKDLAVIEVSYTTKVNGKEVTISYFADASTGERVTLNTGLTDSESVLSADGEYVTASYKVYYDYVDKNGNTVEVSYYLDDKGNIAKNNEGNIGYNVAYTYVNKYGNSSKKDVFIVLDQKGPVVKIVSPREDDVLTANFAVVKWTVNGEEQDTLRVQGLDNGVQTIVRVFRDKAGNESRDSVHVLVKKAKDISIDVEKPVTKVDRDSVEKYYKDSKPSDDQTYSVTFFNYEKDAETEAIVGIKGKAKKGSGEEPYSGLKGHLGPTLKVDARVPVVSAVGGLATLDDIMSSDGLVAVEGVDAANGKKMAVDEYVEKHCTEEFRKALKKSKDYSHMNLYWTTLKVKVWVYSNTGVFTDYYSFDYDLDDPEYVNEAGLLKFYFELKPDENGDVRTKDGRLYGTGAYLFKTEVRMSSKLRCDLPPISDEGKKKNSVIKTSDDLLKSFGYRRPVNK